MGEFFAGLRMATCGGRATAGGHAPLQKQIRRICDPFRAITYRNRAEQEAVLGTIDENPFVKSAREDTCRFTALADGEKLPPAVGARPPQVAMRARHKG
jgi:hypothetical protein